MYSLPYHEITEREADDSHIAEIVLYHLVNAFKFELSDRPIVWNFAGVAYPAINRLSSKSQMYLSVSLAQA